MPKTKLQGVIFGLIMSITMAYGMEVYNVALKSGGLSAMTNRVFWDALLEAAYMWLFVFLFSNLWGNRLGPCPGRPGHQDGGQPLFPHPDDLRLHRIDYVPHHECRGCSSLLRASGRRQLESASSLLGGNGFEELPHGPAVESLCRRSRYPASLPPALSKAARCRMSGVLQR